MHKDHYQQDFSSLSSSGFSGCSASKSSQLTNKKRTRNKSASNFSQKEEERILKFALKQSEKEYLQKQQKAALADCTESAFKYENLPSCKEIQATLEDFKNPIGLIDRLWQQQDPEETGLIKIIPPQEWRERQRKYFEEHLKQRINANDKPLTTRKQTLGLLYEAKKFEHVRELNYEQYTRFSDRIFEENFKTVDKERRLPMEEIEEKYWQLCKEGKDNVTIHYAADISMDRYYTKNEIMNLIKSNASCSSNSAESNKSSSDSDNMMNNKNLNSNKSTKSNSNKLVGDLTFENNNNINVDSIDRSNLHYTQNEKQNKNFLLNNNDNADNDKDEDDFSLLKANFFKNSLLQFTRNEREKQISGITIPWFYLGMVFSTFCWHTEDLYLYSLNYLHDGSPKIWYGISLKDKEKMDEYIKSKYYGILLKQPDLIHRLTVHIDPKELKENGINVYRVVQNQGDIILTLPKAYHTGFSTGLNMAEAVNLSTLKWIDYGFEAQTEYKKANRKVPVFPMEWLVMQNYENCNTSEFDDKNIKNKIKALVNHTISSEIDNRVILENFFDMNRINYIIEAIDINDDTEVFDCDFCTHLGFLSQLVCKNCKKKGCISHNIQCKCLPTDFILRVRYLTKELEKIKSSKKINK